MEVLSKIAFTRIPGRRPATRLRVKARALAVQLEGVALAHAKVELVELEAPLQVVDHRAIAHLGEIEDVVGLAAGHWRGRRAGGVAPFRGITQVALPGAAPGECVGFVALDHRHGEDPAGTVLGGHGVGLGFGEVAGCAGSRSGRGIG